MIYNLLTLVLPVIYPFGNDTTSKVVLGIIFLINILISIIMLPINIRLAGQLVMQVFKYRYICNHVATMDEDNKVMTGYYNHFRAVMCIIIAMVGYNVFNVISAVLFLIYFFKNAWGEVWWYWWIAQGLCAAFQECIILYAVAMLYQIACYVQGKKFNFLTISVFIVIRFIYTSILVGLIENLVIEKRFNIYSHVYWTYYGLFISSLLILESSLRFTMIFSFVRVTQRSVTKYINDFINDMNTQYLDREHFVVKVQAGKLFQIAGWGTICVSFLTSFVLIIQYAVYIFVVMYLNSLLIDHNSSIETIFLTVIAIIQVIIILPSILYSAFLIILWLYFRYKTKVKYSGYSSDDPQVLEQVHRPKPDLFSNQDKFHFTYYKHKNRVMVTTYVVCVVLVSVTFAAFFAPVLTEKWKWDISLRPGDYHLLNNSVVKDGCPDDRFNLTFSQSYSYYITPTVDLNCSENIFAGELLFNETLNRTYKYTSYTYQNKVWIPENSTIGNDLIIAMQSQYPCYYTNYAEYGIFLNNPVYNLGIDSCIGAKSIQNPDQQNFTTCTTQGGQLQCKILINGMYKTDYGDDITIQQFGYQILEPTITPLNRVKGEHLSKYDVILFKSSENITVIRDTVCKIHASCLSNPFFRILMPVLILLCSMIALTIGLILIHKI